jgi:hypothetical protein
MRVLRDFAVIAILAAACLGAIVAHDRHSPSKPLLHSATDFTAFYCAGEVVRAGANPYRVEPLRSCEHRLHAMRDRPPWYVTPVPFPGYVLAGFAAISLLPFELAHVLWIFVILLSVGATAWALARISGFPIVLVALVLAPPLALYDIGFGEPTPVTTALLALAAERAHARAWPAAGVLLALAMLEPHLVLPAFVAVLVFAPAARVPLLAGAAALGALSLTTLGFAKNVEYFTQALPAQAASELHFSAQFSVPHELVLLHVPDGTALAVGALTFASMLVVGVIVARRFERAGGGPACLVLIPPAVALIGGNFAHDNQVLTALGAAVVLASLPDLPRALAVAPMMVLSVVWVSGTAWPGLLVANVFGTASAIVLALRDAPGALARRVAYGIAIAAVLVAVFAALQRLPAPSDTGSASVAAAPAPPDVGPDSDAGLLWARQNALARFAAADPRFEGEKVPMACALLAILACGLRARPARPSRARPRAA